MLSFNRNSFVLPSYVSPTSPGPVSSCLPQQSRSLTARVGRNLFDPSSNAASRFHFPQPSMLYQPPKKPSRQSDKQGKNKKVKKVKLPKGYVSAFTFFAISIRGSGAYAEQFENMSNNETNKAIGKLWRALSDEGRRKFFQLSNVDKLRYLQELAKHNLTHGTNLIPVIDPPPGYDLSGLPLSEQANLSSVSPRKGKRGRKADPERSGALRNATTVQRPRTAYSFFANQEKTQFLGSEHSDRQRGMGIYLGRRWKNMCAKERACYEMLEAHECNIPK